MKYSIFVKITNLQKKLTSNYSFMKYAYFVIFIIIFSIACKSDTPKTEPPTEAIKNSSAEIQREAPTFAIETQTDKNGTPRSTVSVMVGGKKLKVAEAKAFEIIGKTDYAIYQIPANAIAACGGWWEGAGDYFYILDNGNDNYTVMQGTMDEGQTSDSYNYKMVMNLSNRLNVK